MTSRQCADPVCLHARRSGFFFAFPAAAPTLSGANSVLILWVDPIGYSWRTPSGLPEKRYRQR
jgi:hypothetical protein